MGDNFLKQQTENFRKRRDLAMKEFDAGELFPRPDMLETIYKAKPCGDKSFEIGETLHVVPGTGGNTVSLIRGHREVGCVDGENAVELLNALGDTNSPGMIPMSVIGVSGISGMVDLEIGK